MKIEYSEEEVEELANAAYGRRVIRCPRCGAPVRYHELDVSGRQTTPLMLNCQRCGAYGRYSPDHLEAMELEWTREEKVRIIERYWGSGTVRCPRDDSLLKIIKSKTIGPPPPNVSFGCPRCGRHFQSQQIEKEEDPDAFEGIYDEIDSLGAGGMGTVVLVRHRREGSLWAAKRILPKLLRSCSAVKRFRRESRILAALSHPNVLRIRETFLDEGGGVIVMPYVRGGTLKTQINNPEVSYERLASYFGNVVEGLQYLHSSGVIHRDLKPENVLIDAEGRGVARISDFGLARLVDRDTTTLTLDSGFLGTPRYAAPEQQQNAKEVTAKCDIYSLALIAVEILTRQSPYLMPISTTGISTTLQKEIPLCLDHDPDLRPVTGANLLHGIKQHLHSSM